MTTNTTPADNGRYLLSAEDPAELLAESLLCLHERPSDCLLMAGGGGPGAPPLITRSSLRDLLSPRGAEHLERHLGLMSIRGSHQAVALIVIGDGHQRVLDTVIEAVLLRAGELLRAAAESQPAESFELMSVHGAAAGRCWELREAADGESGPRRRLVETGPLREFSDTRTAATAVLDGLSIPQRQGQELLLTEIGRGMELPVTDIAATMDPGELFSSALTALEQLRLRPSALRETEGMTKCEQISALLSAVAVDRLHWELLAQCVERGEGRQIDRETLLQTLVSDRTWIPHGDVRAGGSWYEGLQWLRHIAAEARDSAPSGQRGTARSAWRALTALLVLLAWWNHRFATAGHLVDELWEQEPESTLAPLLSRMTDTPIFPAWWPST